MRPPGARRNLCYFLPILRLGPLGAPGPVLGGPPRGLLCTSRQPKQFLHTLLGGFLVGRPWNHGPCPFPWCFRPLAASRKWVLGTHRKLNSPFIWPAWQQGPPEGCFICALRTGRQLHCNRHHKFTRLSATIRCFNPPKSSKILLGSLVCPFGPSQRYFLTPRPQDGPG